GAAIRDHGPGRAGPDARSERRGKIIEVALPRPRRTAVLGDVEADVVPLGRTRYELPANVHDDRLPGGADGKRIVRQRRGGDAHVVRRALVHTARDVIHTVVLSPNGAAEEQATACEKSGPQRPDESYRPGFHDQFPPPR